MANRMFSAQDAKAVAVLATATVNIVGRNAPVVASLQRLLRERNRASYDAAVQAFDDLGPDVRHRRRSTRRRWAAELSPHSRGPGLPEA